MYYIYYMGQYCGTSETWVDMPPGYELTTEPPPPPPERPPELTPDLPPVEQLITLTEDDVAHIRSSLAQVNPILPDCLELILYTVRGDVSQANTVIRRIKEVINGSQ